MTSDDKDLRAHATRPHTDAGASPRTPSINLASVAYGLDARLQTGGSDPQAALAACGLAPRDLIDPERRVPLVRYLELLETSARLLEDPLFGLRFGLAYDPRHAGVAGNVALACRNLGEAFRTFARYLPTVVDGAIYGLDVSDGVACAYSAYVDPLLRSYQQKADWSVGFACSLVRTALATPGWTPSEAVLPQALEADGSGARHREALLGCPVTTGHPWAGIRFPAALLDAPLTTADDMLERLMRHYGELRLSALAPEADSFHGLRRELARQLAAGAPSLADLAASAGASPRTLQRRLEAAGLTYAGLLDEVRRNMALNLLANPALSLSEIAFSLGYADASAFSHAFRRWTGRTPRAHRQSLPQSRPDAPSVPMGRASNARASVER